jgi:predicted permease
MNSSIDIHIFETVAAFSAVVLLVILLKRLQVVKEENGPLFARLLTQAVLPAVIFTQLAAHSIHSRQFLLVAAVFVAGIASMLMSYLIGRLMRLDRPKIGALMLTSSFGSSALLGYPLITYAFPHNPEAMTDAVLLSELGVGLPIFILAPLIGMIFGEKSDNDGTRTKIMVEYFKSPIFIAVVLGLAASQIPAETLSLILTPFSEALTMIGGALTLLACLTLGLQLKLTSLKGIWPLLIVSALIQMAFQPWLAQVQAGLYHLGAEQRQVLILISSMPSAVLGPVFAARYRCAGDTASALVMFHIIISMAAVPAVFTLLNG